MARRPHQSNNANLSGQGVGRGDATSSGLACQAEWRGPEPARRLAGQTRPSAFPLRDGRIVAGEVVNDRFVRPLAAVVSRQARGQIGGRPEARRCGARPEGEGADASTAVQAAGVRSAPRALDETTARALVPRASLGAHREERDVDDLDALLARRNVHGRALLRALDA